jgi:antitoxin component YwqK of YwqJK toxin-antitoxin module
MPEVNENELYSIEDLEFYNIDPGPVDEAFFEVLRYHNGSPFTGKAIADYKTYTGERYYIDGLPHGLCFGVYRNGQRFYEAMYNHGHKVGTHATWNESGVLIEYVNYDISPLVEKKFDDNGRLFYERFISGETENHYYKTGELLATHADGTLHVFAPNGELAYKRKYNDYINDAEQFEQDGMHTYEYHDKVLNEHITALAGEQMLRSDLVCWVYNLEGRDRNNAIDILNTLIGHSNLFIKSEAIAIAGDLGFKECQQAIQKESKNNAVPGHERDHGGLISYTNDTSVSQTAREALGAITGAN